MRFIAKYKQIVPGIIAILILAVAIVCSSISFAWYSYNKTATVAGDSVQVSTPITVYISDDYTPTDGETKFTYSTLEDNGFGYGFSFTPTNVLYPASTVDGESFRYASNVDLDGRAIPSSDESKPTFIEVTSAQTRYFYIEKSFYMTGAYMSDVEMYLSDVVFAPGSEGTSLYKSVRIAITYTTDVDGTPTEVTRIVKRSDGGSALPAVNGKQVSTTDPAIGNEDLTDSDIVITLPAMTFEEGEMYCNPIKVTFKIWIEGQNDYAVVAYAGTAFTVALDFDVKR